MTESRLQRLNQRKEKRRQKLTLVTVILLLSVAAAMMIHSEMKGAYVVGKGITQEAEKPLTPQEEDFEASEENLQEKETFEDPNLALLAEFGEEAVLNYRVYKRYLEEKISADIETKTVYLTIDDGPNPKSTTEILNILAEKDVKATFFVLGAMIQQHPQLLIDIVDAGHELGSHSFSHVYKNIYRSANDFLWEMNETKKLIETHTGVVTNIIRAPGGTTGHFTSEFYRTIENAGYIEQDWNVDSRDSASKVVTAEMILHSTIAQSQGKSEVVVLFHDSGRAAVIQALPKMIDYFIEQEYIFKTLPQDRPIAIHRPKALRDIGSAVLPVLAEIKQKNESEKGD